MVLGFALHGCATTTTYQSEVSMWQAYRHLQIPYKVYAKILEWQGKYDFGTMFKSDYSSLDNAIAWIYQHKACSKGCIITHIGNNKISLERQEEIAEKWLPEYIVKKYFKKPKKPKKKKVEKKKEEDQLAKEKKEKEEEKTEKKEADDDWF